MYSAESAPKITVFSTHNHEYGNLSRNGPLTVDQRSITNQCASAQLHPTPEKMYFIQLGVLVGFPLLWTCLDQIMKVMLGARGDVFKLILVEITFI